MHLPVPANAPVAVQIAAAGLLVLHIGGAGIGLVSGGVAMAAPKGGWLHRAAGNLFFVAMLAMAGVGAAVAPFLPEGQVANTFMGGFTFYLVITAWVTVRRRPGRSGRSELGAALFALAAALAAGLYAGLSAYSPHPLPQPEGTVMVVFAGVAALAAACDFSMIRRGGLVGAPRILRHLWRMGTALAIAALSFAGQPKAIPPFLHGSPLVLAPFVATLAAVLYWLGRYGLVGRRKPRPAEPKGRIASA